MAGPLRVLIVEDNEDDALLMLRALRQSGYAVSHERVDTPDGMERALDARTWDLVISDYSMPHFSALGALDLLKRSGMDLPFLIVSGTVTEDMAVAGMRAGAHDYLMKGSLARLGPAVERELQEAANRQERRRAEQALRASDERFRVTFNQAAVGIAHVSMEGRWLLVNQKLCDIVGYSSEELLGSTFQEITHPDDLQADLDRFEQLKRGEVSTYSMEKRYLRKGGEIVWIHLTVALAHDAAGMPEYCISVIEDITDRKRTEDEVQTLNARLRQAMTETHHRVKNNLQIITAMVDMYQHSGCDSVSMDEIARLSRCVRSLAVVHDLLTQQSKRDQRADWISARELLERLLPTLQQTAINRRIDFHIDDTPLSTRQGTSLALITNELVSNALKHSRGEIDVAFIVTGGSAQLTVSDDGPGFAPDFDPQKAANTGLELVENLTRLDLAGQSSYENQPDNGACVVIQMPLNLPHGAAI
jgi:PAS domain S-box-containing protein